MYFTNSLYNFFCDQKIDNYYLKGKRGLIEFQLNTLYFKENNLFTTLEYIFDIFTAYSPKKCHYFCYTFVLFLLYYRNKPKISFI